MFCKKCGNPTEGDQTLCSACAAEQTQQNPVLQEEPPVQPEVKMFDDNAFELNTPSQKPAKKKGGLIAGIVALAVVIAAVVGIALNMDSIKSFFNRTLSTPQEYMVQVEGDSLSGYADALTEAYGTLLSNTSTEHTSTEAELHLLIGDELLSLAELSMSQSGMEMDLSWLSDIMLAVNTTVQDDIMQSDLGIGLGEKQALTLRMIYDMTKPVFYMAIPELNETYLSVDMSGELSADELKQIATQSQVALETLQKALPDEKAVNSMIDSYLQLALSQVEQVEMSTETVTVNGTDQKLTVLTSKISQEDLLDMGKAILEAAKDDQTLKAILAAAGDYTNTVGAQENPSYEKIDVYGEFTAAIPNLLAELEAARAECEEGNYLILKTYVDTKDNVVGRAMDVYGVEVDGPSEIFRYMTARQDDTAFLEAQIDTVTITGSSTIEANAYSGSYRVAVEDSDYFTLEFEDMTETSGTLRLIPGEELLSETLSSMGIPASLLSDDLALELTLDSTETEGTIEFHVVVKDESLIGLTLTTRMTDSSQIQIPDSSADTADEADVAQWLQNLDFTTALQNLEDAGVPSDLVDLLETYIYYTLYSTV